MVKVLSTVHHGLRLPALDVKFVEGVAEVSDELLPKVLAFAHLGVILAEDVDLEDKSEEVDEDESDSDEADEDESDSDEADEDDSDESDEADDAEEVADKAVTERPRRNGSQAAWAAYAKVIGVPVPEGATRDDIRALFD
ncbi:hypothetical protein [Microbacterium sp.]|uniref:hypothetical protein n=1 Tax=Microbacterium sp. TaxID=51671 RepID=UPI003A8D9E1B